MTKKDFELIAAALKQGRDSCLGMLPFAAGGTESQYIHGHNAATFAIANALANDNPRFDRERFLKAAGVVESPSGDGRAPTGVQS